MCVSLSRDHVLPLQSSYLVDYTLSSMNLLFPEELIAAASQPAQALRPAAPTRVLDMDEAKRVEYEESSSSSSDSSGGEEEEEKPGRDHKLESSGAKVSVPQRREPGKGDVKAAKKPKVVEKSRGKKRPSRPRSE